MDYASALERARRMQAFYSPGYFGTSTRTRYADPLGWTSEEIADAPPPATMGGFDWRRPVPEGETPRYSAALGRVMQYAPGEGEGAIALPPGVAEDYRLRRAREVYDPSQPRVGMANLAQYGVGQLSNYGVGALSHYGRGALQRRR